MAMYPRGGQQQFTEMAIPIILAILVIAVVATQFLGICPGPLAFMCSGESVQTLILTNDVDFESAKAFGRDISSRVTKITPVVDNNVLQHIKAGSITSNDYDLLILFGDNTALTAEARDEITAYVNGGGSLIIVKGAGLHQMQTDGTISEYTFGWAVDDMASVIQFEPECPTMTNCNSVNAISVLASDMSNVQLTPVDYQHDIIQRIGITAPLGIDISKYADFSGIMLVKEPHANNKITWIDWTDATGKPQSAAGIIAYSTGATGGKVVYLAYNPLELNQEDLFRTMINWATA